MIDEVVAGLRAARTTSERTLGLAAADDVLTPGEYLALGRRLAEEAPELAGLWRGRKVTAILTERPPEPYRRRRLAPSVLLFEDPAVPRAGKTLIVAFSGLKPRLMFPNVVLLQTLPAARFDLALLYDPSHDHFVSGCPAYASSFLDLVGALQRDLDPAAYRRRIACGTSMGGLPAVRYGVLAGFDRMVAVSARRAWHVNRLHTGRATEAFDPVCACRSLPVGEVLAVYGADNAVDAAEAARLHALIGARLKPIAGVAEHNPFSAMWRDRSLPVLLGELFDFEPAPPAPPPHEPVRRAAKPKPPAPPRRLALAGRLRRAWRAVGRRVRGWLGRPDPR